jgi:hypothetical protein
MTLVIQKPTGAKLNLRKGWQPMDADAAAYITAVETADGQALEERTKIAIDNFVLGCKADGIWTAIKASCILAGARTLTGALVPLLGTAPTNNNFVAGDYNRKTGLVGNSSTKYLNSNRACSLDGQNNVHVSVWANTVDGVSGRYISGAVTGNTLTVLGNSTGFRARVNSSTLYSLGANGAAPALIGVSRASSTAFSWRFGAVSGSQIENSGGVSAGNYTVFASNVPDSYLGARLAFYSIGESLNLALLDARVTDLINAFGAAIA